MQTVLVRYNVVYAFLDGRPAEKDGKSTEISLDDKDSLDKAKEKITEIEVDQNHFSNDNPNSKTPTLYEWLELYVLE